MAKVEVSKRYSEGFKKQVVEEYEEGTSATALCRKYGVGSVSSVTAWVKEYGREGLRYEIVRLQTAEEADQRLESAKWYLWHGNPYMALERLEWLYDDIECFSENEPRWQKLFVKVDEFVTYIRNNYANIPNYGERYTYGETISTAFVESTVNQVISKRFVKKQQMRWTKRGAHLLLQMRTHVLNNDLQSLFQRWYPDMTVDDVEVDMAA